ncbi:MAG: selenium-dependent xanthine dehydrogenase [Clostridiales Family XIII bacterium]|jgi:selenium-dependent xanthine dehydrogenase|nr:selenium-dependent xanthine dehydrogenase [Clostridiales Family XIII bacterium]
MAANQAITINGQAYEIAGDKTLLRFLRDDLRLTSVKDGCSEGACGTCTVIVDGKAVKACARKLSALDGSEVVTVEGLSEREKTVYAGSFAAAGAVQCGFCIPGMIMSAKALLDKNDSPTRADVKKAIKGNICRCTGYVKIEEAILLAAECFRSDAPAPSLGETAGISDDCTRSDALEKALGTGRFADDIYIEGMIHAKAVRSPAPRALIKRIDTAAAEKHPDCIRVLTAKDVPNNKLGHIRQDWDVMIAEGQETRYIGDALALVASSSQGSLDEIISLIEIDYDELPPVLCPTDALKADAPLIHSTGNIMSKEYLRRGNVEEALKDSAYVVTKKYFTPHNDHAFMEPECAVAAPDGEGGLRLYTGGQSVYDDRREVANMLKLPAEKVRVTSMLVGGGFGGKEDMSVQHHAALMAWHTGRPVKVKFSRQESIDFHTKRHAMEMEFTTGCDSEGRLTAMKAVLVADTGAYASLGGPVLQRACTHAAGPYNFQNIDILGMAVYTNNVVSGAYRGFGVTQSCFAMESNLNLLAEKVGISPWEIRYLNAIRPGQVLPNGQIADPNTAMAETLEAVKDVYEAHPRAGIACAFKNSGKGVGLKDIGRCTLSIDGGKVHVRTSAACMGQGIATMCMHMVCEATGLLPKDIVHEAPDTVRTPDSGTSTASRQTVMTGEATRRAAAKLREALDAEGSLAALEGGEWHGEFSAVTDPMGAAKDFPVSHVSYSYATQVMLLDEEGRVERVVAAYDVGSPVNPRSCEGQIEGGIVMGLGFALTEDFPIKDGRPTAKLGTLGIMRAPQAPPIDVKFTEIEKDRLFEYSYGAKGVGELCLIPTSPAAAHAYYRMDGVHRNRLPLRDTYYRKG